ncbi:MAG: Rrf2 family transcriptional regulator [Pirellulales bacterium]|nr:Rrf2 family transcriptional regulator [Pirellulales bacterium]
MKMSRTVAYAVQASIYLAQAQGEGPVPCSRLASEGKMPERFLLQILRHLVARGILASTRGVDGGYCLDRPADEVSLLEVIEAIDGPLITDLPLGDGLSGKSRQRLTEAIGQVTRQMREQLAAIKLAHLTPPRAESSKRGRS